MQEAKTLVEKYKKIFEIPEDIKIEIEEIDQGQELIYIPEEKKAILKLDKYSIQDIPELIAQLKLGIEYHPLLATFYFQKDLDKEEEKFARAFYVLVIPVIDAWVWKIMKKYLPEDEFEKELAQLTEMWEKYELYKMYTGNTKDKNETSKRRITLSHYLIRKALDIPARLEIVGKDKRLIQEWVRYKKALEDIATREPDVQLLAKLPEITRAPYKVKIKNTHFEIRKK